MSVEDVLLPFVAIPFNGVVTWNLIEIQNNSSTAQMCIILNEMNDCFGMAIDFVSQNTSSVTSVRP